jgi:hypothetical protein
MASSSGSMPAWKVRVITQCFYYFSFLIALRLLLKYLQLLLFLRINIRQDLNPLPLGCEVSAMTIWIWGISFSFFIFYFNRMWRNNWRNFWCDPESRISERLSPPSHLQVGHHRTCRTISQTGIWRWKHFFQLLLCSEEILVLYLLFILLFMVYRFWLWSTSDARKQVQVLWLCACKFDNTI